MMKFILLIIICSGAGQCMPPIEMEKTYLSKYDCLISGYETSKNMMIDIGEKDINKNDIYMKFICTSKIET